MQIRADGIPLECASWEESRRDSNGDGEYLELRLHLAAGWRLDRQLFLARRDRFLFFADTLVGDKESSLEYEGKVPLYDGVRFEAAAESHEGWLSGRRRLAQVVPLAIPEWRVAGSSGGLAEMPGWLGLRQRGIGRRLFAPLFVDWQPSHVRKTVTWRKLTIADQGTRQADDVAVGYRLQVGSSQWLVYRSLGPPANRSVLGQNFATQFVLARFTREGEAKKLIEIA